MSRKLKLGVDVDGTLYETWGMADAYVEELTGEPVGTWESYDHLYAKYPKEIADAAFEEACGPQSMHKRVVYPGVVNSLKRLRLWGIEIVYITKNHDPDTQAGPLNTWLYDNVAPGKLCVLGHDEDKMTIIRAVKAFGMIDDKPDFISNVAEQKLFAASLNHSYVVGKTHPDVQLFDHWSKVPDLVWRYFWSLKKG